MSAIKKVAVALGLDRPLVVLPRAGRQVARSRGLPTAVVLNRVAITIVVTAAMLLALLGAAVIASPAAA